MAELPTVPVLLRVHLAHATVQAIADEAGVDVLHIKGPAVAPSLRPEGRASVDADVLVRPAQLASLQAGLQRHGWQQVTKLRSGGLVEHSTNWYHPELGQLDVHVRFPGIQVEAGRAFDVLWRGRGTQQIAHRACVVPGVVAHRLILLLHAARDLERYASDVDLAWEQASEDERTQLKRLAQEMRAEVALAAATGRLEAYRDRPEYALWRLYSDGTVTTAGFRRVIAEVRAAPDGIDRPRLRVTRYVLHALVFMPRRLASQSGNKASWREIGSAYRTFLRRGRDLAGPHQGGESEGGEWTRLAKDAPGVARRGCLPGAPFVSRQSCG